VTKTKHVTVIQTVGGTPRLFSIDGEVSLVWDGPDERGTSLAWYVWFTEEKSEHHPDEMILWRHEVPVSSVVRISRVYRVIAGAPEAAVEEAIVT
jgi:hypothetical protein